MHKVFFVKKKKKKMANTQSAQLLDYIGQLQELHESSFLSTRIYNTPEFSILIST